MSVYRFGEFELDTRTAELRRHGCRVRLRPQPCAALACLVARHGQFVSRQELQRALWPDGTYVRFEDGLNSCMKQIRAALGDSRTSPRYIETLTRRGYRFIAPVVAVEEAADLDPAAGGRALAEALHEELTALTERIVQGVIEAVRAAIEERAIEERAIEERHVTDLRMRRRSTRGDRHGHVELTSHRA